MMMGPENIYLNEIQKEIRMNANENKRLNEQINYFLEKHRDYVDLSGRVSLSVGLLMIIEHDSKSNDGELKNKIGYANANILVEDIIEYGRILEDKGICEKGFFSDYAFARINSIDATVVRELFNDIWAIYNELDSKKKGLVIISKLIDSYSMHLVKTEDLHCEPERVRKLICGLAEVKEGNSVYDPCMGAAGYVRCLISDYDINAFSFSGTEINDEYYYLSSAVLMLGQLNDYKINRGNSLTEPDVSENYKLNTYDRVITHPPIGQRLDIKDYKTIHHDLYGRFRYGIPGKANADWPFIEAAISATNENGKALILTSSGPLFRAIEAKVRANILYDQDMLEAVIQLPSGLLMPYTAIPINILIFNKNKKENMKGKVLSVNAEDLGSSVRGRRNYKELSEDDIRKIIDIYQNPIDIEGFSRIFSFEEIANNDYSYDLVSITKSQKITERLEGYIVLEDVTEEVMRGVQVTPKMMKDIQDVDGSHYMLNLSNLEEGRIIISESDKIMPQKKWIRKYEVKPGDIIVSARGSFKCAVVDKELPPCIVSGNLLLIRLHSEYSPYVLKYFFDSELGNKLISQIQSGVTAPILNAAAFAKIMIPGIGGKEMKECEEKIISYIQHYEEMITAAKEYKESSENELNVKLGLFSL